MHTLRVFIREQCPDISAELAALKGYTVEIVPRAAQPTVHDTYYFTPNRSLRLRSKTSVARHLRRQMPTTESGGGTRCEICARSDGAERMLLCGNGHDLGCNRGFHMDCLAPPLTKMPESNWFCDRCAAMGLPSIQSDVTFDPRLPGGWKVIKMVRNSLTHRGKWYCVYVAPDGKRYRSMKQALIAARHLAGASGPPRKKQRHARVCGPPEVDAAAAPPAATVWPGGSNWLPKAPRGTRRDGFYGCGKCRWRPKGCRGCIASAVSTPPAPPMPNGVVFPPVGMTAAQLGLILELRAAVEIVSGPQQSDPDGYGVVAKKRIAAGTVVVDPTAVFQNKPSDYAAAHLDEYDYIAGGSSMYVQICERVLRHRAFTFLLNEARGVGAVANVEWLTKRGRDGDRVLVWRALADIPAGAELLVEYGGF